MKNESNLDFSIVVPVYNEESNLAPLRDNIVKAMSSVSENYEVILVDDGSTDKSREVIKKLNLQNNKFKYLFFDQNHGQTSAFDAGFKAAQGKIIITMDADLQVDAHDIPLLIERLDKYDAVIGYRQSRNDSWIKKISSKIANSVRNKLSNENIRDVGCPLKAIKRECLQDIKLFEGMHRFFPTLIKLEGYTVLEVPVSHHPRLTGNSKYNISNRLFKSLRDLFAVRWMIRRHINYRIVDKG